MSAEARGGYRRFWPAHVLPQLATPATNLFYNLEVAARRWPDKPAIIFYDTALSFAQLHAEAQALAGYLQQRCAVEPGARVLLFMQNSPQFVIAYYAILRANAVVVPVNPMNLSAEVERLSEDAGALTAVVAQELFAQAEPLLRRGTLRHVIVVTYGDYLTAATQLPVPEFVAAPRASFAGDAVSSWAQALAAGLAPGPLRAGPDALCVMPYTSGTTGEPRGCMHTHRTTMHTLVASMNWFAAQPEMTLLAVAPFFHVTGMQGSMNGPIYCGCTTVLLPRWDRQVAAACVDRYRITSWTGVPAMVQDFFANPQLERYDLSSIRRLSGGGAAMPAAVAERLRQRGIAFCEGYGMSETCGATHINPTERPKLQCLGLPIYDVDSRVVDPETLAEMPPGEVGEIVTHAPQLFLGYWNRPEESARACVQIDGKRFLRTGDLGYIDEDGYFFMVDRLKRMINAAGFKVWPSEVETSMYQHPGVLEACVIGKPDPQRGETVKAFVIARPEWRARLDEPQLIAWCREHMAAYKVPRSIDFVESLPKSGSGKVQWRVLQEQEAAR
jgi:fatty-acyl-CoA synthase